MYVFVVLVCVCVCTWFNVCVVEREENVKADIFTAYRALLSMTQAHTQPQQPSAPGESDAMELSDR